MLESIYRKLCLIRRVEEEVARIYPSDKVMSPVHLSIGQEAIPVAVCVALGAADVVYGSYRCHALYLAKGGDLDAMIAELFGKATGIAKGKAGSMHLIDVAAGMMGASAVVSSTIPLAVGHALAMKMQRRDAIVACFFGDGAVEEGVFHESLNYAALKRLPVLFVCENNGYAVHARLKDRQSNSGIGRLAEAHGIAAEKIDSRDVDTLIARAAEAVRLVRAGEGPRFLEARCYRWMEHVGPATDFHAGYRGEDELAEWRDADPLRTVGARLAPPVRETIEQEEEARLARAFDFAEKSPFPADSELYTDMYEDA